MPSFRPLENARQRERFISTFLRSELLLEYVEYCSKNDSLPARAEHSLRKQIMQVLQEFFTGLRFPKVSHILPVFVTPSDRCVRYADGFG